MSGHHEYLTALRTGDRSLIKVQQELSADSQQDFANFKTFLSYNGNPNPQPDDLYLTIKRKSFLKILMYAKERNCLGLQYCFGFSKSVQQGGKFLYVNKATIMDRLCKRSHTDQCELEIYESDFLIRDIDLKWQPEHFSNFQLKQPLPLPLALNYIAHFKELYKNQLPGKQTLTGSLLPVRALLATLNDPYTLLGSAPLLSFRWGLTSYIPNKEDSSKSELGSFTLVIGIDDVSYGPVIERRRGKVIIDGLGDCPPRNPCGT